MTRPPITPVPVPRSWPLWAAAVLLATAGAGWLTGGGSAAVALVLLVPAGVCAAVAGSWVVLRGRP